MLTLSAIILAVIDWLHLGRLSEGEPDCRVPWGTGRLAPSHFVDIASTATSAATASESFILIDYI